MGRTGKNKIILFDGVCNLCNGAIQFIIKNDKNNMFKFAPLQSDIGIELLRNCNLDSAKIDSMVLIENGQCFIKSAAALRISGYLSGAYPLLSIFLVVPPFIRNWVYDIIASNRYKWFGKQESCMIPTQELKERFL